MMTPRSMIQIAQLPPAEQGVYIEVPSTSNVLLEPINKAPFVDMGKDLLTHTMNGDTDKVRDLMAKGAPFTTDWLGTSPLHLAAQYGHLSTAEVLLRAGISRDARTKVDKTPLHVAATEGHIEIVEVLISHGAELNARDMLRMTPLHWAVDRGHKHIVELLLRSGALVDVTSKFDKTPLDIAIDNNRQDIKEMLQNQEQYVIPEEHFILDTLEATQRIREEMEVEGHEEEMILSSHEDHVQTPLGRIPKLEDDQSSTPVLGTLEGFEDASAMEGSPNAGVSQMAALKLLEAHGITMLPTDDTSLVASAVENGQTISLTEAGKLALHLSKPQGSAVKKKVPILLSKPNGEDSGQKVFTLVGNQLVPVSAGSNTSGIPMLIVPSTDAVRKKDPFSSDIRIQGKKFKIATIAKLKHAHIPQKSRVKMSISATNAGKAIDIASMNKEQLALELAEAKRAAEQYKEQLRKKEHEAEEYRKQLESFTGSNILESHEDTT